MDVLILVAGSSCLVASLVHLATVLTVIVRLWRAGAAQAALDTIEGVSVLRPVCGSENYIEETLGTSFLLDHPRYEVLFCAAKASDPAIPVVRKLMAEHPHVEARLLIGNSEISANPKLNNLLKGWHAARYEWVLMADSNVLMPRDHIARMQAAWTPDTGLVCSPPVGGAAGNAWAELECAFLNTYQARWQCFADSMGWGFAQGKAMLWRRELLEQAGGIAALADEIAEDAAATKAVRALGLRVRLVTAPFTQPLGRRSLADVWRRQVRWARLRRDTFKLYFVPEILGGALPPLALGAAAALAAGWPLLPTLLPLALAWYGAEALLAQRAGWHLSWRSVPIWMLRDALLPALWIAAWLGSDFEWRGNAMTVASQGRAA
jgi:ceramide glucosyltransferase